MGKPEDYEFCRAHSGQANFNDKPPIENVVRSHRGIETHSDKKRIPGSRARKRTLSP